MKKFSIILKILAFAGFPILTFAAIPDELDFQTVLQVAMENSFDLRQAQARLEGAKGRTMSARAGRTPDVTLSAGYTRIDENKLESFGGSSFGDTDAWTVDVQAAQPLYTGGAIKAGIESAEALQSSEEAVYQQALQDTLLSVHEAWYAVLLAREVVKVREASIELLEKELNLTRDRVETGTVSRFELLRAEVSLANAKPPYIRAMNQYRLAVVDLLRVIGIEAMEADLPEIVGELEYVERDVNLSNALSDAKRNRPEYRSIDLTIDAARADVRSVESAKRPALNLFAGYGIQKSSFSDSFDDTVQGWTIGLQGSWKIWDGQSTEGQVISAQSRLRQFELSRQELDLLVGTQVQQALSSVREAMELVDSSRKVVEQAEEVLELAEDRYSVGTAIQIEVFEAQLALTQARTNEIQALHDYNLAIARLDRAVGKMGVGL